MILNRKEMGSVVFIFTAYIFEVPLPVRAPKNIINLVLVFRHSVAWC